ncbi:uncharacterized protein BX664DRAFT_329278 [Halteromyces radiatus]|uniref:uncharacterized protein n=1 Tax=Halteromyces radiatus TaxID=101107 RepID=UPI00222045DF|nr:uncharacterized protein BX664DRAFT_329278 [Halteromyces radiatus]KAI8093243.1 hypothetical protein BX664DRAFT_329278 [Halteromyces radiatus]
MSISLSTCYNNLGLGRWEELCHEFLSSVLPMEESAMSLDDLSSSTWRIIFLKDDCFLQSPSTNNAYIPPTSTPTTTVPTIPTSSPITPTNTLTITPPTTPPPTKCTSSVSIATGLMDDTDDVQSFFSISSSSPSSPIEPLFDGIDFNHHPDHDDDDDIMPSEFKDTSTTTITSTKKSFQQRKRKRQAKPRNNQQKRRKHNNQDEPTCFFDQLSCDGIRWCRYCGTTETVNWRPGPWGKRTLCNKHGCDYKGYGVVGRSPRLDLSAYRDELLEDRHRPVIQDFCALCHEQIDINKKQQWMRCDGGCSRAYHHHCFQLEHDNDGWSMDDTSLWFCDATCYDNRRKKRVIVDLPRIQPLMHPKKQRKSLSSP